MKQNKVYLVIFSTILLFLWQVPVGIEAQDANQAALVIRHDDQSFQTVCVEFLEPEISGLELLQRSGFDLDLDVQGLGAAVCSIGQTGCPADDCWCQCKGGTDCIYWSYWQSLSGHWQYAQGGASTYTVSDGDMQGWSWGPGAVNVAFPPPNLSFETVCTSFEAEDVTPTPTPTSLVFAPADTPISETRQSQPTATITNTPLPTSTIPPTATSFPAVMAVPTTTQMPTVIATVVPVVQDSPDTAPADLNPMVTMEATTTGSVTVPTRDLKPAETSLPSPTVLPSPQSTEVALPAPETAVALALVDSSIPTRLVELDTKKRVEIPADSPQTLTVIGTEAQVPDLRTLPLMPEEQNDDQEGKPSPSSLSSYLLFSLIVLGLVGWLTISAYKRRDNFITFEE
jgi:hypothetical protein